MPNWCSNTIAFEGTASQLKNLQRLFKALTKKELKENRGQFPDFVKANVGWLFCIRWEENALYYETKWSPNLDIIVAVADHFKVDFVYEYEECGNLIFGKAIYKNKCLSIIDLEDDDFDLYEYNEENDNWIFEGEVYSSDYEIKELLLERKDKKR